MDVQVIVKTWRSRSWIVRYNGRVVVIGWKLMRANDPFYGHDNEIEQCFSVHIYIRTIEKSRFPCIAAFVVRSVGSCP